MTLSCRRTQTHKLIILTGSNFAVDVGRDLTI